MKDPHKAIENLEIDMSGLKPKDQAFIANLAGGNSQGMAYAKSRGREKPSNSDYVNASKLIRKAKMQKPLADMNMIYKNLSEWALRSQLDLAQDSKTPASVKNAIYKEVQDRAGHNATHKVETTKKVKYPEFNMSPEQLHEMIEEAKRPQVGEGV